MRKSLLYLTTAIILGIVVILAPLVIFASFRPQPTVVSSFLGEFSSLERGSYQSDPSKSYVSDLTVMIISFVIAVALYLFVKHKTPPGFIWVRIPPY